MYDKKLWKRSAIFDKEEEKQRTERAPIYEKGRVNVKLGQSTSKKNQFGKCSCEN